LAKKPIRYPDKVTVIYDDSHWSLLSNMREEATALMRTLLKHGIESEVHGSVARGDVESRSDVDVIVRNPISSSRVELALRLEGHQIFSREFAQATPNLVPKGHIFLDPFEKRCVSFPLLPFRKQEYDFYRFGGIIDLDGLARRDRVPGCTKKLTLIEPFESGHYESSIIGREAEVARLLGIKIDVVLERIRVLMRRDEIGRTGNFIIQILKEDESFEGVLKRLAETNPAVRRALLKR